MTITLSIHNNSRPKAKFWGKGKLGGTWTRAFPQSKYVALAPEKWEGKEPTRLWSWVSRFAIKVLSNVTEAFCTFNLKLVKDHSHGCLPKLAMMDCLLMTLQNDSLGTVWDVLIVLSPMQDDLPSSSRIWNAAWRLAGQTHLASQPAQTWRMILLDSGIAFAACVYAYSLMVRRRLPFLAQPLVLIRKTASAFSICRCGSS